MNRDQDIELAIVLLSLFIFVSYHFWLFFLRGWLHRRFGKKGGRRAVVFDTSRDARLVWTFISTHDKTDAGVPAVQTLRNSIMAASFMATTCGLMATSGLLPILTDSSRLEQIARLGDLDPICDLAGSHGLVTAPWKIGICEFLLLVSLMFFVQSIRLLTFLSYFIKIRAAGEPYTSEFSMELTLAIAQRSGHCWSIGTRSWTMFIPALFWIFGPTTLLVVTCLVVLFLAFSDEISIGNRFSFITEADKHTGSNGGDEVETGLKQGGRVGGQMQEASVPDAAHKNQT